MAIADPSLRDHSLPLVSRRAYLPMFSLALFDFSTLANETLLMSGQSIRTVTLLFIMSPIVSSGYTGDDAHVVCLCEHDL